MAKIVLNDVTNINSLSVINDNFDKIEQEFQDKVLYRNNTSNETNMLVNNIDCNGKLLFNVGGITLDSYSIPGIYLGAHPSDPTLGLNGPLRIGDLYFFTGTPTAGLKIFNGLNWQFAADFNVTNVDTINPTLYASEAEAMEGDNNTKIVTPFTTKAAISVLRSDLSDNANPIYGTDLIGYRGRTLTNRLYDFVSVKDFGAVGDGVADDSVAISLAMSSGASTIYFPRGTYGVSSPITMNIQGLSFKGESCWSSSITPIAGFIGNTTIDVNGERLQSISDLFVSGDYGFNISAITITDGPLFALTNVVVKFGQYGIKYISGNSQRWYNVFAESNTEGILVIPGSDDNTNGCIMQGIRAFNNTNWGIDIQKGSATNGHMHSTWDASAENNGKGIRIRAGRYGNYTLYSESNTASNFDLDSTVAHYYFLKNPDSSADGGLHNELSKSTGFTSSGGNLYFDLGYARTRVKEQSFAASGSLAGEAVGTYYISNISGGTRNLTLSFLAYIPIGFTTEIIKVDNTAGFNLVAPGGITLVGKTGTFGAFVPAASAAVLQVRKINSTTALVF